MNPFSNNRQLKHPAMKRGRHRIPRMRTGVGMSGFSMVEVLVALLVLSIGLLGLAGLQASGLRYSGNSALRTQSLILTQDIIERMHANATGVSAENYEIATIAAFTALPALPTTDCAAATCTAADLATYDLVVWKQSIVRQLPTEATATIDITASAPPNIIYTATVTIIWTERQTEGASGNQSLITAVQL